MGITVAVTFFYSVKQNGPVVAAMALVVQLSTTPPRSSRLAPFSGPQCCPIGVRRHVTPLESAKRQDEALRLEQYHDALRHTVRGGCMGCCVLKGAASTAKDA